ncbi:arsenite efflux ATP-binding protein ArsA [Anaerobacterium chartisolvens]|uniref:arsenite-transporting ATPase n=1 Tax=Anaerobacterium chartisolvens TaxID=1297424 RepID=A0A369ASE0_9FIRM|nr:TRC40/GET3/ArsA family transport-energizing ATPase [Anaerobacterium chartisolvens]RCX11258.1 arsenite efflux ATP-binding protein ArsA [Anaerobacterium chartisolvens]
MRIILYTGKGGVGKTSVAAATAVKSAEKGLKTLVVSTDPAHSLGDSLDIKLSPEPAMIKENLWAQEIDSTHEVEKGWGKVQEYLTALFTAKTVKDITTEELTIFPGIEDLLSLLRILNYYNEKTFDVIIIDCAPTGETLALLSFPDMLRWWMDKLFPLKRKALKFVKPVVEPLLGVPMPSDNVMGEIEKIYSQLDEMRKILSDRSITSVRIVVNPEKMVIKEAQRSFTYLNIYDFNIDAIVVNRVIPESVTDEYFKVWKDIQSKYKQTIIDSFSPLPIYYAPLFENEIVGMEMLERMGEEVFKEQDPIAISYNSRTQQIVKDGSEYVFSIYMPFTDKKDLSLNQKGEELIIRAGSVKRNISLPKTLANLTVKGAKFEEEILKIRFGGESNE